MTSKTKKFLKGIVLQRELLLREKKSYRNESKVRKAISDIGQYMEFYPRISERQLTEYIRRNKDLVLLVMVGKTSPSHSAQKMKLNEILRKSPPVDNQKLPF